VLVLDAVPEEDLIIANQSSTKIRRGRSLRGDPGARRPGPEALKGPPRPTGLGAQAVTNPGERRPMD